MLIGRSLALDQTFDALLVWIISGIGHSLVDSWVLQSLRVGLALVARRWCPEMGFMRSGPVGGQLLLAPLCSAAVAAAWLARSSTSDRHHKMTSG